ncbi:pseudouridine synthase [Candidatus Soleaferrea massiliensis]|uniref:pseudouridine synthase n=1 Tax=Candidatus Soleaferrea massiliensis TaxID=1470354 RepID=UPI000B1360B6|nr:16S rRNA pseudouridine(516) synthase [Candidatus Soleaferrea massiliensis]
MAKERIDKLIASQGKYSRSQVKDLVRKGMVRVNGERIRASDHKADPDEDQIQISSQRLQFKKHLYIMLNKPKGVVSATEDRRMKTVLDLLPEALRRRNLFPAGRLDRDTEGFVLITDDGEFAHRILSPKNHIPKTYEAEIDGPVDDELIRRFHQGVSLGGDTLCRPAELRILRDAEHPYVQITICEGMYHQIKRMFEAFGRRVLALKRVRMGALALDDALKPGECRELTPNEVGLICMKRL